VLFTIRNLFFGRVLRIWNVVCFDGPFVVFAGVVRLSAKLQTGKQISDESGLAWDWWGEGWPKLLSLARLD
jgi:hypothetical protein